MTSRSQITRIKGVSAIRQLPRLGKIRLGIKKLSKGGKEYPAEVDYFVCPISVQQVYGMEPKELDVMFPVESEDVVFPQSYKWYVSQGLRCKGDGERALRRAADLVVKDGAGKVMDDARSRRMDTDEELPKDENDLVEIGCPCPLLDAGQCGESAALMVMLPRVSPGGVFQISTGSFRNIVRINSAIEFTRAVVGRIALVPMKLRRQEEVIEYEGKKAKHYLLQLELDATWPEVAELRRDTQLVLSEKVSRLALPEPVEDGPDPAPGAIVIEAEEDEEPTGSDPDLSFLDPEPVAADDPLRAPTTFELKLLAEAADKVGALVEDPNNAKKKAVVVSDAGARSCGLPAAGTYRPSVMTVGQIIKLTQHYNSIASKDRLL